MQYSLAQVWLVTVVCAHNYAVATHEKACVCCCTINCCTCGMRRPVTRLHSNSLNALASQVCHKKSVQIVDKQSFIFLYIQFLGLLWQMYILCRQIRTSHMHMTLAACHQAVAKGALL